MARHALLYLLPLATVLLTITWTNSEDDKWLPALHRSCLKCICEASTGCNTTLECNNGYCGPFGISRIYWVEAERPVLPYDDPERVRSYEDCANLYSCAVKIVSAYMIKLAKDCNGDGIINCDDFMMMHGHGGYSCNKSLTTSEKHRSFLNRYLTCKGDSEDDDPLGYAVHIER